MAIHTRLRLALLAADVPVVGVKMGDRDDKTTWTVIPDSLQSAAQATIDTFDPTDPVHEQAELDEQVKAELNSERLTSAVVWMLLKQMYPSDTDAQTKTKYGVARTRIIDAYRTTPWK